MAGRRQGAKRYHHGDLQNALVQAARDLVEREGASSVTLRKVATEVGVSHPATYRHFADKRAVLAAVAMQGFVDLRASMLAEADAEAIDLMRLPAVGRGYVDFAADNPAVFRLMFGELLQDREGLEELERHGRAAFQVVIDEIAAAQQSKLVRDGDSEELATIAWSQVHGFATLWVDGHLGSGKEARHSLLALAMEVLYRGFAGPAGANVPSLPR